MQNDCAYKGLYCREFPVSVVFYRGHAGNTRAPRVCTGPHTGHIAALVLVYEAEYSIDVFFNGINRATYMYRYQ